MNALDLDAIEARATEIQRAHTWFPGAAWVAEAKRAVYDKIAPHYVTDVPALVAALRESRLREQRLAETLRLVGFMLSKDGQREGWTIENVRVVLSEFVDTGDAT